MSGFLVPPRSHRAEWMDRTGNRREDLKAALADIALANRYLGGLRALLASADPYLRRAPEGRPLRILDVGTGGADLPRALADRARRHGTPVMLIAVDLDPITTSLAAHWVARQPDIRLVQADARRLPFRQGTFDLVCASLFLHHFVDEDAVTILRRLAQVCRGVVLVNDLQRHRIPWAFIAAAARLTRRHPMFVHDAPLSVLRGFTGVELSELGRRAGLDQVRVSRRWPFRLVLTARQSGAPGGIRA